MDASKTRHPARMNGIIYLQYWRGSGVGAINGGSVNGSDYRLRTSNMIRYF